ASFSPQLSPGKTSDSSHTWNPDPLRTSATCRAKALSANAWLIKTFTHSPLPQPLLILNAPFSYAFRLLFHFRFFFVFHFVFPPLTVGVAARLLRELPLLPSCGRTV